ncbi:MAG: hypothetical protein ABSB26_09930 [Nitrososphaerales archaeon]|jgi:hypothetical protein
MKRNWLIVTVLVIAVVAFLFLPFLPRTTANFGGGQDYSAWVSPSFAFFQCGAVIGHVGIEVTTGSTVNPADDSSYWNCGFPRL